MVYASVAAYTRSFDHHSYFGNDQEGRLMKCPKCGGKAVVKNTLHNESNDTYRKIQCTRTTTCGHVFYTIEYEIEYDEQLKKEMAKCERAAQEKQRLKRLHAERRKK